jgi:hypothetical protein
MTAMPLELKLGAMLKHVLPLPLLGGAIGAWLMHRAYGWPGVELQAVALGIAFVVMFGSAAVIKVVLARAQAKGRANAAYVASQAFTMARMGNVLVLAGAGVAVWCSGDWPNVLVTPFFLWLAGFYLVMLFVETYWLTRMLKGRSSEPDENAPAPRV